MPPALRDEFEDAAGFGWSVDAPVFDWPTLIANKDKEIARLEAAYTANLDKAGVAIVKARAVLEDAHTVRLATGERVKAAHILIATGGQPSNGPAIPGIEHVITSNEAFHLPALPRRILMSGRRLHRGRIRLHLRRARRRGHAGLSRREHPARFRRRCAHASARRDGEARHRASSPGARGRGQAVGRWLPVAPHRWALDRRRQGHVRDRSVAQYRRARARGRRRRDRRPGAVVVDEYSRSTVRHIYAVGDVTDRIKLTPVAIREGHAFADTVFGGRADHGRSPRVPTAVFSQPEVGAVGLTEARRASGSAASISTRRRSGP